MNADDGDNVDRKGEQWQFSRVLDDGNVIKDDNERK